MHLQVDHATIAGSDLGRLQGAFERLGIPADYGGMHSNGVTHMALLGFEDGSYLELISTKEAGARSPWWPRQIERDGGPCAWSARAEDIAAECERLRARGVPVRGPNHFHRVRPDGERVEWDLAVPGAHELGAVLPFLIQDRTPRTLRVQPSPVAAERGLTGVANVVIGVRDLAWTTELFHQVYGWITRETRPDPDFGATVVSFTGTPVALVSPSGSDSWLGRRLAKFGDSPAALLLRTPDLDAAAERFPRATAGTWLNRPALWLRNQDLGDTRLGIVPEMGLGSLGLGSQGPSEGK